MDSPRYLVDETAIVAQHDTWIAADREMSDHVALINGLLDFIDRAVRVEPHTSTEHLMQLRLSIRCFNSIAASLRLIRCGYWHPAFSEIRELIETLFLLDLLATDAEAAAQWHTLPDADRKRVFSPLKVRTKLDDRDGFKERKRQKAYDDLSRYASHPTPEGFTLISPENTTQIGPFPDERLLRAALQELVKRAANVSVLIGSIIKTDDRPFLLFKSGFYSQLRQWSDRYMNYGDSALI